MNERRKNLTRARKMVLLRGIANVAVGVSVLAASSCVKADPGRIEVRLQEDHTQILKTVGPQSILLGQYPAFPALDPSFPRIGQYLIRFSNASVVLVVPDASLKERIKAWNDQAHLFDVLFVGVDKKSIATVVTDLGTNIRIVKAGEDEKVFIFQLSGNDCNLALVDASGDIKKRSRYHFVAYPDIVSVATDSGGYRIVHDNIDDQESFRFEESTGNISSISYQKHTE